MAQGRRLSNEVREQIVARYAAGENTTVIASALGISVRSACRFVRGAGIMRTTQAAQLLRFHGLLAEEMVPSAAALRKRYFAEDKPSLEMLGKAYQVDADTVRRWLVAAGARIRSRSEQIRIEIRAGRLSPPIGPHDERHVEAARRGLEKIREEGLLRAGSPARSRAGQAKRRRSQAPCVWCGQTLERTPSRLRPRSGKIPACSLSCAGSWSTHLRYHPDAPRPIIVQKLYDLCYPGPFTEDRVRRKGEQVGAGYEEVAAVVARGYVPRGTIAG